MSRDVGSGERWTQGRVTRGSSDGQAGRSSAKGRSACYRAAENGRRVRGMEIDAQGVAIQTHHSGPRPSPLPLESRPELCPAAADAKLDGRLDAMAQYYAAKDAKNGDCSRERLSRRSITSELKWFRSSEGGETERVARLGSLSTGLLESSGGAGKVEKW